MASRDELYSSEGIRVFYGESPGEHYLLVGDRYYSLSSGVLERMAKSNSRNLPETVQEVGIPDMKSSLEEAELSYDELGWNLAKARIIEIEEERNSLLEDPGGLSRFLEEAGVN